MPANFEATVSALCYSIIAERCPPPPPDAFPHNDAVRFVLGQVRRMPDYLRLPFRCLTLTFDACGWRAGAWFHTQVPETRRRQLDRWRRSRLGVCRDLVRFYESLVILWWNSASHDESDGHVVSLGGPESCTHRAAAGRVAAG